MDKLIPVVGTMALLGSALVGGIFFAFSSFIMKALAGVPKKCGIMQCTAKIFSVCTILEASITVPYTSKIRAAGMKLKKTTRVYLNNGSKR